VGSIKQKMGYCKECGNTEPMPIIKDLCVKHYWYGKRKPIERKPTLIDRAKEALDSIEDSKRKIRTHIHKAGSVSELLKLAEIVFNKWIRDRDKLSEFPSHFKCISCGLTKPTSDADCGHYISKMYSSLRFDEDNCNSECQSCNREDPNHLIGYRINLIEKVGLEKVLELEAVTFASEHKWDKQELLEIISKYKI